MEKIILELANTLKISVQYIFSSVTLYYKVNGIVSLIESFMLLVIGAILARICYKSGDDHDKMFCTGFLTFMALVFSTILFDDGIKGLFAPEGVAIINLLKK